MTTETVTPIAVAVLKKSLMAALHDLRGVPPKRPTLPCLAGVHMSVSNGFLTLAVTDLETWVSRKVGAKVEDDAFAFVAPYQAMLQIVSDLPDERLDMYVDGNNLVIAYPGGHVTLEPVASPEDYPPTPLIGDFVSVQLSAETLKALVRQVIPCCAIDSSRPALQCVCLDGREGGLNAFGTDGFRLAVLSLGEWQGEPLHALTNPRLWSLALKYANKSTEALTVQVGGLVSRVDVGYTTIITSNTQGTYRNYHQLIPTAFTSTAVVDRLGFLGAVKMAAAVAREASGIVRITGDGTSLTVAAHAEGRGDVSRKVSAAMLGKPLQIAFSAGYLLALLGGFDSALIQLDTNTPSSPGVFSKPDHLHDPGPATAFVVVMPMFVEW